MSTTSKSSDSLPALGVSPNSIPAMTDYTVSRSRVWDDADDLSIPDYLRRAYEDERRERGEPPKAVTCRIPRSALADTPLP
jgi:hypothetical protein